MPAISTTPAPTAAVLKATLAAAGVDVAHATITRRQCGDFLLVFHDPDCANYRTRGTDPARVWAERVRKALPDAEISNPYDSISKHRPVAPVFSAQFTVRLNQNAQAGVRTQARAS